MTNMFVENNGKSDFMDVMVANLTTINAWKGISNFAMVHFLTGSHEEFLLIAFL